MDVTTTIPCDGYNGDTPGSIPALPPGFPAGFTYTDFLGNLEADDQFRRLVLRYIHPVPDGFPGYRLMHLSIWEQDTAWDLEFIRWSWPELDQWRYRIVPADLAADMLMTVWPVFVAWYAEMVAGYEREHAAEIAAEQERKRGQFAEDCADIAALDWLDKKNFRRIDSKVRRARAMGLL